MSRSPAWPLWIGAALVSTAAGCNCTNLADIHDSDGGRGGDGGRGSDGGRGNGQDSGGGPGDDAGEQDSGNFFYDGGCGPIDAGNPPYSRLCAPPTANECDGTTDAWLQQHGITRLNGTGATAGNGYDDDCDGLVDEGCPCNTPGGTKPCYDVPASMVDGSGQPVGWCATNSVGTVDCAGTEVTFWSGTCRGAQPPYAHDVCGPGDFNCDGLPGNPDDTGCDCASAVTCPTTTITEAPYPPPNAIQVVDGTQWIAAPQRAQATNWTWTVLGGDCDNVLFHPTFAIYNGTNTGTAARIGTRTPVQYSAAVTPARYVASAGAPLISIQAVNAGTGQVYPAFSLSGDYIVQGEFDLNGQHYACTQKVAVRAPGIRAELCWDDPQGGQDVDIHFARLQGTSCANHGWFTSCPSNAHYEDCYYSSASGCPNLAGGPNWGYANSPNSACVGWGSKRTGACSNPRLDLDNITCTPSDDNPLDIGSFCGPENINLDNPNDGDTFVVGVNYFGNDLGPSGAKPHVDLYCNGARVLTAGYNPANGQTSFPLLSVAGADSSGDFWNVATIKAHVTGGQLTSCDVTVLPPHSVDPTRDGPAGSQLCVESQTNASTPSFSYTSGKFVDANSRQGVAAGSIPATPAEWCKH